MPEQANSRDFAFQSSDQAFAHHHGGAEGATNAGYPVPNHDRYNAQRPSQTPSASPVPTQAVGPDSAPRYPDFNVQQPSFSQPPAQFPGYSYGYSPGGALAWNWNSAIEFTDFANHYEPQGELVQELQNQAVPNNDFSIPLPVSNPEPIYQSLQQVQSAQPTTNAQNPLSPPPKPPSRPFLQTGMKRKAESEPGSAVSQTQSLPPEIQHQQPNPAKRANKSRSSSSASITSPVVATTNEARRTSMPQTASTTTAFEPPAQLQSATSDPQSQKKPPSKGTGPQGRVIDVSKPRRTAESSGAADVLPAGKVFPIQIGSELFRLSGASISSDAPSYFSHFFGEQLHHNTGRAGDLRTLYIDRDPDTFREIALHLQGYYVTPRDGEHFVKLFADAQFYSLPRLTKQLFSTDIFIRIGGTPFQIPRDLFSSPGDNPNYFSLGFAQFFSTPTEVFPGLDRSALLRPPSISPPAVPNRSGETFRELVKLLQGYNVEIRNEAHRAQLLRDARYFHLKGLEQRLIPCDISYNLKKSQQEILIRLEDIRQSGVSFKYDESLGITNSNSGSASQSGSGRSPGQISTKSTSPAASQVGSPGKAGTVSYARPYTDDHANSNILILEISSGETTTLHLPVDAPTAPEDPLTPLTLDLRATFHGSTLARITSLFGVISSRMGLPATQPLGLMLLQTGGGVAAQPLSPANSGVSERRVRVRLEPECYIEIDNSPVELGVDPESKRIGIKRSVVEQRMKRVRVNEEGSEHEGDASTGKTHWVWGGSKDSSYELKGDEEQEEEWVIKKAHWRLRVEPVDGEGAKMQVVLCGVRIEGFSIEKSRNQARGFLEG